MKRMIGNTDMRVTQTLASGLIIRQDFRDAVRFVFFDTGLAEWQYATHGGTMFVVRFGGSHYALTCKHVLKDFDWRQLVVTNEKGGTKIAGLKAVFYPSQPKEAAVDSDILDVAVIQFSHDIGPDYFNDCAYVLDAKTVATSRTGDVVHVAGALKSQSAISEDKIAPIYCLLELADNTLSSADPTLRSAIGKYKNPEFSDVVGLSGSPVFNVTKEALCGMVVRGGMSNDECTLRYIDIFDIMQLLGAIDKGLTETHYKKTVVKIETTSR
jgi:Trypsin-like peptidase domain